MKVAYYCISLKEAKTRQESIRADAVKANINLNFVEAIPGSEIDIQHTTNYDNARRLKFAQPLYPNEVACSLSHKKALEAFIESDNDFAVVFEDDAGLPTNLNERVHEIIANIDGFDAINLHTTGKTITELGSLSFSKIIIHRALSCYAVGYLYSRKGARKVIQSLHAFYVPFDTHLGLSWKYKILTIGLSKPFIQHKQEHTSTIGARHRDRPKGIIRYIRRRYERISNSLMKRIWAFKTKSRIKVKTPH